MRKEFFPCLYCKEPTVAPKGKKWQCEQCGREYGYLNTDQKVGRVFRQI